MGYNTIMKSGIRCLKCGDKLFWAQLSDSQWCKCRTVFIDGGDDSTRIGFYGGNPREAYILIDENGNDIGEN
jgi:hypothetical protein